MSKLFGWFNKNKNENKTPEPATNPPQEETSDSNEVIAVEKENESLREALKQSSFDQRQGGVLAPSSETEDKVKGTIK